MVLPVITYLGVLSIALQMEPGYQKTVTLTVLIAPVVLYVGLSLCMAQGMKHL